MILRHTPDATAKVNCVFSLFFSPYRNLKKRGAAANLVGVGGVCRYQVSRQARAWDSSHTTGRNLTGGRRYVTERRCFTGMRRTKTRLATLRCEWGTTRARNPVGRDEEGWRMQDDSRPRPVCQQQRSTLLARNGMSNRGKGWASGNPAFVARADG
ncbi:hypothetical protein BT67DRAFT_184358 [Trichocladium antarcticum]|uniref:Uncharacterized protein n=1 Tax=Trichocladium antarcticum TaxID=1450529 RepID=A0AAN6ZG41_9PEZI|nr:hypothetical protein BT67DRAFT_184358 [Trichocladium antarcticum]